MEMAAVLALAGAATLVAAPVGARMFAYWELWSAARRIAEDLRECQSLAESEGVYYEMRFFRYQPDYTVYRGTERVRMVHSPEGVRYRYGVFPLPISTVRFLPQGSGAAGMTIQLVNRFGDRVAVRQYLDSGVVTVFEP
ncbi:MAG: hypothetical protein QJR06_03685 [Alicyclobacillaceae bacterium]|nr:hypothetical protein [Alicyclobacillaceae bacterium]